MWSEDTNTLQKINKDLVDSMVKISSLFIDNKKNQLNVLTR